MEPELFDSKEYRELLDFMECVNGEALLDAPGIVSAAVVFRSAAGGFFLLGSAKGRMMMTGTLKGGVPRFGNDKWIEERGKGWRVRLPKEGGGTSIHVSRERDILRSRDPWTRLIVWINGGPNVYGGTIRDPRVVAMLTEFFSMRLVDREE